jgi:precorrin-2 dehydrogenase/sirohydrochlorin ferrochelatase
MDSFPAFFPLRDAKVVIAGEGEMANAKARLFAGSPATLARVVGEAAAQPSSYAGARLVFVASEDPAFRRAAAAAARAAGVPVNVVDDPALCDFHTPAVIDRGAVVVAVGTAGAAPLLAAVLRDRLAAYVPPGVERFAALLGKRREAIRAAWPDIAARRAFLLDLLEGPGGQAALAGETDPIERRLDAALGAVPREPREP